jgi:uncharacterized membrane protein
MTRAHWRLLVPVVLFVVVRAALLAYADSPTVWLIAWNVAIAAYLGLAFHLIYVADVAYIRFRAEQEDVGRLLILTLVTLAALASLLAIVAELGGAAPGTSSVALHLRLSLTLATIFLSWTLIHTVFAFHYAHEYYGAGGAAGGLDFRHEQPDYGDFIYFSFVIGMTSQVSDVTITSRRIRRTATMHGVLSFFFNAAVLALMINIAASAISPTK